MEKQNNSGRVVIGAVIALGVSLFLALLGIVPVLTGTAAARLPASGGVTIMIGVVLGVAFLVASVAWLIAWFTYGRLRTPDWGYAYFLMPFVFVALIYGAVASTFSQFITARKTEDTTAWAEISKTMKIAMDPHGGHIDMRIHAKGEAGEMEAALKSLMSDLIVKRDNYLSQMQALGIKTIMQPANLSKDKGLKHTSANLAQARAVLKDFRQATETVSANFRRRLDATHLSEADKQAMMNSFDRSYNADRDLRELIFTCEDNELEEFQKMVARLKHPKGRWIVQGNKILFYNKDDLAAYQESALNLRAYAAQENAAVLQARGIVSQQLPNQNGFIPPQRINN